MKRAEALLDALSQVNEAKAAFKIIDGETGQEVLSPSFDLDAVKETLEISKAQDDAGVGE